LITAKGLEKIYEIKLSDDEKALLQKTIASVKKTTEETNLYSRPGAGKTIREAH
jgi:malate/lactate dehydrogenase